LDKLSKRFISKTTRTKWNEGTAQTVEHLLCEHKALSSNPPPKKKPLKNKECNSYTGMTVHICNSSDLGSRGRRTKSLKPSHAKVVVRPCLKNKKLAQVVECLSRMCKVLGLIPSTAKKKNVI
jgi:hypothetical protein